jgi:signal peptidase I
MRDMAVTRDGLLPERRARKSRGRVWIESIAAALLLFLLLRTFIVQAIRIPSPSMEETLLVGDLIVLSKLDYGARVPLTDWRLPGLRAVRPGDVIVFQPPPQARRPGAEGAFIKRCVALGGQSVEIRNKRLYVDGELMLEPYALHRDPRIDPRRDNLGPWVVPAGHLFVLGDNRDFSDDSRFWGALPMNLVHGRAVIRYFSWDPQRKRVRFDRLFTPVR